jgi:hypothetical protein
MTKHRIKKNDDVGVDFVTPSYPDDPSNTEEGLEFVLGHFLEPIWPRTISTHATKGRQILVFSKEEAHARFKQANYLDCRINAYPDYIEFSGINRQTPNFILIDIDKEQFKSERAFWSAVNKTIQNLKKTLDANPTIIWTGNGVHIYQPLHAIVLEQESLFSRFNQPSRHFLRFAARYLSSSQSDPRNTPTFKSCLVRIPGSYNYKNIRQSNDTTNSVSKVRIIQRWDQVRPRINPLLYEFYIFLADQKLKEINSQDWLTTIENRRHQVRYSKSISDATTRL